MAIIGQFKLSVNRTREGPLIPTVGCNRQKIEEDTRISQPQISSVNGLGNPSENFPA